MPKSGVKISAIAVIRIIVFLLIGFILFSFYTRTHDFLLSDRMFNVSNIYVESSIQFIDKRILTDLKGQNIFTIDIKKLQQRLSGAYPQISHLRVVRELPDRIKILAKRRDMLFEVNMHNKVLLVDAEGIAVIYVNGTLKLPVVVGFNETKSKIKLGQVISQDPLRSVIAIFQRFRTNKVLSSLKLVSIDVANPAKIVIGLENMKAKVIVDTDHGIENLNVLGMLLSQHKLDLNQVDYIDLRFDQPVISSQPEVKSKRGR